MKNSTLGNEVKVFGETANQDLTSEIQEHLDGLFDDELEQSVIGMKRLIDASSAQLPVMVVELDRRQIPRTEHDYSTTAWLRHFCRMTGMEASGTVKTARSLSEKPEIAGQAIAGNIAPNGVKLSAQSCDIHPDEFADREAVFADIATYLDTRDLRRAVSLWEQQVDFPAALEDVAAAHARRRVYFNQTYEGMWATSGDIDPESGHAISVALRSLTDPASLDRDDNRSMMSSPTPSSSRNSAESGLAASSIILAAYAATADSAAK
jgi:hypothetical protein